MTEQNYLDPGQSEPISQIEAQELQRQIRHLLERIGQLERQLVELQQQLTLAQGGTT
jgi:hypothetical protein